MSQHIASSMLRFTRIKSRTTYFKNNRITTFVENARRHFSVKYDRVRVNSDVGFERRRKIESFPSPFVFTERHRFYLRMNQTRKS